MTTRPALGSILVVLMVAAAAGTGSPRAAMLACPSSNPPNQLVLADGSDQTAQLGTPFQAALQVQLANTNACPLTGNLAGYEVTFTAPDSGASGTFAGSGSRQVVVGTNAQGSATAPVFTANDTAGGYTVDAQSDVGTVELELANSAAGLAAAITTVGGTPQAAAVDSSYAQPLRARVVDADGTPVQGAIVSFAVVPGSTGAGAGFPSGGQATATTDSNGIATSPPLLANGSSGRFTAIASTDGVATVASYSLDNHAAAEALSAIGSTVQSATVASRYAKPLTVRLVEPNGQPIEGASITFALGSGATGGAGGAATAGATFAGGDDQAIVLTDADGRATSPSVLANDTPGDFTATATITGSAMSLTYALRNLPATIAARDLARSAIVGHRFARALTVTVRGADRRPLRGITVTFTIGTAGNTATATFANGTGVATATTNAAGIATAPAMTASSVAGGFKATATVAGSKAVTYRLRNRAGRPQTITTGAADGSSTVLGARLPVRLAVTVTDANGNPVAGALVRFAAPAHGPGGRFTIRHHAARLVRVRTNADGIAIAPAFTANRTAGGYAVLVRAGATRAAFALVNRP